MCLHWRTWPYLPFVYRSLSSSQFYSLPYSPLVYRSDWLLHVVIPYFTYDLSTGLIDYFTTLFFDVTTACLDTEDHADNKIAHSMLQNLLDTLHSMFKYVSEVVRKALQVHRGLLVCWSSCMYVYSILDSFSMCKAWTRVKNK